MRRRRPATLEEAARAAVARCYNLASPRGQLLDAIDHLREGLLNGAQLDSWRCDFLLTVLEWLRDGHDARKLLGMAKASGPAPRNRERDIYVAALYFKLHASNPRAPDKLVLTTVSRVSGLRFVRRIVKARETEGRALATRMPLKTLKQYLRSVQSFPG